MYDLLPPTSTHNVMQRLFAKTLDQHAHFEVHNVTVFENCNPHPKRRHLRLIEAISLPNLFSRLELSYVATHNRNKDPVILHSNLHLEHVAVHKQKQI